MFRYRKLSSQERDIILHRHTELPNSGSYNHYKELGIYVCKQCDSPLYMSSKKFPSSCGWPSFEEEIEGTVEKRLDPDGRRMEIICVRCQGHLGHVFVGEHLTKANVRHCVNSLSLLFIPAFTKEGNENAFLAGGCFWGIQAALKSLAGVISTTVGYMGGYVADPTYTEVCTGQTGHLETVKVICDPTLLSYEDLLQFFFDIHNPFNNGVDQGPQYESCIFYLTERQKISIEKIIENLSGRGIHVLTKVRPASTFYPAEEDHQNYYEKKGHSVGCINRNKFFK